jgi:putative membrane protein
VLRLLLVWLVNTVALLGVAYLMPSVRIDSFAAALIAAAVLGLANAVVRPVLVLLTLPVTVLTLGLFIFVINGLIFLGVAHLVQGFQIAGLWPAILAAIVYSILSWLLSALVLR